MSNYTNYTRITLVVQFQVQWVTGLLMERSLIGGNVWSASGLRCARSAGALLSCIDICGALYRQAPLTTNAAAQLAGSFND